jgi:glycosyltransferase involved in cell wall biosynthesis
MTDKPIRILECVNRMDRAGLETMLMNHYRAIDRSKVQFDFLTHRPDRGEYDDEIESLGGHIYHAPRLYPQNYIKYARWTRNFFATHYYPVVHSHIDAMSAFPLAAAKRAGVPVRIAHSHSESIDKDFKYIPKQIARKLLPRFATDLWACSHKAGIFLYGKENAGKIKIIRNAIDLSRYSFNPQVRDRLRSQLGISPDEIVIGHVGRLVQVKNHALLVRLAEELSHEGRHFEMYFVGEGELQEQVKQDVIRRGLENRVHLLGLRNDVADLMQAFDVLVFPSFYEGIPLTLIEAQAAGLPVIASDHVSSESLIAPNTKRLSLNAPIQEWAAETVLAAQSGRCKDSVRLLTQAGYDIHESAKKLQMAYLALWPKGSAQ